MSTDVIGSRYQLEGVVTRTVEATTWRACDRWLHQPVLVVTPEPAGREKFGDVAATLRELPSPHLLGLYDAGRAPVEFVVFPVPPVTLAEERIPRDEDDVLAAGRSLGDAVAALHDRGIVHGNIHPGSVVPSEGGDVALSPWPLAPPPDDWDGPGGFGSDPDEHRAATVAGDLRALGALLLGALAGPPLLSSEQMGNLRRELRERAPGAVHVVDRALTPARRGGYWTAGELRDDSAIALAGTPLGASPDPARPLPPAPSQPAAADDRPEGRRVAVAVSLAGALLAGAAATGALSGPPPHAQATARACAAPGGQRGRCAGPWAGPRAPGSVVSSTPPASVATAAVGHVDATVSELHVTPSGVPAPDATPGALADVRTAARTPAPTTATGAPVTTTTVTTPPSGTTTSTTSTSTTTTSDTTRTSDTTSTTTSSSTSTTTTSAPAPTTTSTSGPPRRSAGPGEPGIGQPGA